MPGRLLGIRAQYVLLLAAGAGGVVLLRRRRRAARARAGARRLAILAIALITVAGRRGSPRRSRPPGPCATWPSRCRRCCSRAPAGSPTPGGSGWSPRCSWRVLWAGDEAPEAKSNVRAVAAAIAPSLRPGDLVVSTQPEQVPVLHYYLPAGAAVRDAVGPGRATSASPTGATAWSGCAAPARRATSSRCSTRCRAAGGSCWSTPVINDIDALGRAVDGARPRALGGVAPVRLQRPALHRDRRAPAGVPEEQRTTSGRRRCCQGLSGGRALGRHRRPCASPGSAAGSSSRKRVPRRPRRPARACRPCARRARGRSPGRARSRPPRSRVRPRWKRSKICSRSAGWMPGPRSATSMLRAVAGAAGREPRPARPAGRSAARCRAGSARRGRSRPGRRGSSTGRAGGTTSSSTPRSSAAQRELGGDGAGQLAELDRLRAQRHRGVQARRGRAARRRGWTAAAARGGRARPGAARRRGPRAPSRRSSSSSSIVPWSIVSGVRSSCEAVATNERRAASWRRSSSCMRANARARSPTSSRPSSCWRRGVGTPSSLIRSAAVRRRPRRRSSVLESATASAIATSRPTAPAASSALRTCSTAVVTSVSRRSTTSTPSTPFLALEQPHADRARRRPAMSVVVDLGAQRAQRHEQRRRGSEAPMLVS